MSSLPTQADVQAILDRKEWPGGMTQKFAAMQAVAEKALEALAIATPALTNQDGKMKSHEEGAFTLLDHAEQLVRPLVWGWQLGGHFCSDAFGPCIGCAVNKAASAAHRAITEAIDTTGFSDKASFKVFVTQGLEVVRRTREAREAEMKGRG